MFTLRNFHNILRSVFVAMLSFLIIISPCASLSARADSSSEMRTVKVGYYLMTNFQEYDSDTDEYSGYSYEYLQTLAQYANWKYEFVKADSYESCLQMLKSGEIDIMNFIEQSDDLTGKIYYSSIPSGDSCTCLDVKSDNAEIAYEDFDAISGLKVALNYTNPHNSQFIDYCKDNDCMPVLLYLRSDEDVDAAVSSGEADACIESSLNDVSMRTVAKFATQNYYIGVSKNDSEILSELNSAMNSLKTDAPYYEESIYNKYHKSSQNNTTVYSSTESEFLSENSEVSVVYDPSWYPVSYTDSDGSFKGAVRTIFDEIQNETKLNFRYVSASTNSEALEMLKSGQAQVMACFPYDYTYAADYNSKITLPFLSLTIFSASKKASTGNEITAFVKDGYRLYLNKQLSQNSNACLTEEDDNTCLNDVLSGKADNAFLDSYQVSYYQGRAKYSSLQYNVLQNYSYSISVGVSDSADSRLLSILDKSLQSIGSGKANDIFLSSVSSAASASLIDIMYSNPMSTFIILLLLGFLLAILISIGIYTKSMKKKNMEISEAANAKSEFLSNISHDMRTPLNGIIGYTRLAMSSSNESERTSYLSKIKISGEFLLNLINDTLEISKIESGKFTLNPEHVKTDDLIESLTVSIQSAADTKNVHFVTDTKDMYIGYIYADRLNIQKIILNLLSNAIKFTPENGTVSLSVSNHETDKDGNNFRIIVSDNGIGISEDFMKKMFEPFTQEHAPEAKNTLGTGLGLSIVKHLVTEMKGKIEVKSEKGKGTTFTVELPITIDKSTDWKDTDRSLSSDSDFNGWNIILAEDNYMNSEIAQTLLKARGINVTSCENGKICVDTFKSSEVNKYKMILMDLRMPVMNGYEATAEIRSLDRSDAKTIPILAMTADAFDDDIKKCLDVGMNGHISKPIDPEVMFSEISRFR